LQAGIGAHDAHRHGRNDHINAVWRGRVLAKITVAGRNEMEET